MRFVTALSVALAMGFGGMAAAQNATPGVTTVVKAESRKPTSRNVTGTVKSASADVVVVVGRDKGRDAEWTFAVELTTSIRKGTKSIVAGDLRPGDAVQVQFSEQDGRALARSILVKRKS